MKDIVNEKPSDQLKGRNLALIDFIGNKNIKNKIVLDIGCGFGWLEYNLGNLVKQIIAIDLDNKNLVICKKYVKEKNVIFTIGNALKIPIETNSLDVVVASELIEHLPKNTENIFFKEVNRVLKKGETFYLTTPFDSFLSKIFDPAWWLIKHRHYSHEDLIKLAKENGFIEMEYKIGGKFWSLLGLINLYISKWIFKKKPFFGSFFDKKETQEFFQNDGWMNIFIAFKKV